MDNSQRSALGKGLSSLIPSASFNADKGGSNTTDIVEIPLEKVVPNPGQPRKHFSESEIQELSDSIKEYGVLQPIMVHPAADGKYAIIAGERRWQAAKKAGILSISAIIKEMEESDILAVSIIENIQRQDLSPLEEAMAYNQLMKMHGYTQDQLSKKLCKSRSHIANLLRLLNLPQEVQDMIGDRRLSAGHAKLLLGISDPLTMANDIIEKNLSVRQTEDYIKDLREYGYSPSGQEGPLQRISAPHPERNRDGSSKPKDQDIVNIENSLSEALGSKVKIVDKSFGGQVIIDFYNLEQLDSIINQLSAKSWL